MDIAPHDYSDNIFIEDTPKPTLDETPPPPPSPDEGPFQSL
jgi:hypothetical protein